MLLTFVLVLSKCSQYCWPKVDCVITHTELSLTFLSAFVLIQLTVLLTNAAFSNAFPDPGNQAVKSWLLQSSQPTVEGQMLSKVIK